MEAVGAVPEDAQGQSNDEEAWHTGGAARAEACAPPEPVVVVVKQILFVVWLLACLVGFALFTLGVAVFFVRQGLSVFGL